MLSIEERLALVVEDVWQVLPPLKRLVVDWPIILDPTLGATHGECAPEEGIIRIHPKLLTGDALQMLPLIDVNGADPPLVAPWVSRAWHTICHEVFHAIGFATGLDQEPAYLALYGWVKAGDDPPHTGRYWERRPGWEQGPSAWRYRKDGQTFFVRDYSSKSPYEAMADSCAHIALGWTNSFGRHGQRELAWLRRHVWEERGPRAVHAATERWRQQMCRVIEAAVDPKAQRKRWLIEAQTVLGAGMTRLVQGWRRSWTQVIQRRDLWPRAIDLAAQVLTVIAPPLTTLYQRLWTQATGEAVPTDLLEQQTALQGRAAASFGQTTLERLATHVTPFVGQEPSVVEQSLDAVHADALQVRTPMLVQTEAHRVAQGAARDAALLEEKGYGTWRIGSNNPCEFCVSLEGRRFPIAEALFHIGDTVTSARGKEMTLEYETVYHPPIHVSCGCSLEYD